MTSAGEIKKRFRNNPELFTLKKHEAAKSDTWEYFSLLFEKQGADSGSLTEVKYLCVWNAYKRVYAYKASDGSGFGDMQFATDYNNGITYVMNALSMRVGSGRVTYTTGSGRVQKRVTRGQLCGDITMASCYFVVIGGTPRSRGDVIPHPG